MMAGIYGYLMLLWFWGSGRKRAFFSSTRKQLSSYFKVCMHRGVETGPRQMGSRVIFCDILILIDYAAINVKVHAPILGSRNSVRRG